MKKFVATDSSLLHIVQNVFCYAHYSICMSRDITFQLSTDLITRRPDFGFFLIHCCLFPKGTNFVDKGQVSRTSCLRRRQATKRRRMCAYQVERLTVEDLKNPLAKKPHYAHFTQDRNTGLYKTLLQSRRQSCAVISNSINESVAGSSIFHIVEGSSHYLRGKPDVFLSRDQAVASHAVSA